METSIQETMDAEDKRIQARCCSCCSRRIVIGVFLAIGCTLVIPPAFFTMIFKAIVAEQLVLINGTEAFKEWQSPPVTVYMTYHVFNYTNVDSILTNHTKPNVTQLGPYVYKILSRSPVVDYDVYTLTYFQNYSYIFDKEKSCKSCSEDDVFVAPSFTAMTIINEVQEQIDSSSPLAELVDIFLKGITQLRLFQTLTVKELIWGYNDTFLTVIKDIEVFLMSIGVRLPPAINTLVPMQLNSTAGMLDIGNITILTGKKNIKDVQRIIRWRGLDEAAYWLTKYGGMINGTDGSRGAPFTSRDDTLYYFVMQICRSLYVKYSKDVTVDGINTYQFTGTPELFANYTVNPDNFAFCSKGPKCWPSGLLPLSECRQGVPIFVSEPHFYQGAPELVDAITGMHPKETLHRTYMNVEPITGIALESHKQLQINVMVKKSFLSISHPFKNEINFLPVLFFDAGAMVDAKTAKMLRDSLLSGKFMLSWLQVVLIGAGAALILYATVLLLLRR